MASFQPDQQTWLIIANAVIWLGLGCYIAFLGHTQHKLAKRCLQRDAIDDSIE